MFRKPLIGVGEHDGVLVVLLPEGSVGGADVRGAPFGVREVDVLAPENLVSRVDAFCLAPGGPAGLAAADGVLAWLRDRGRGFAVGAGPGQVVPIVPAACSAGGRPATREAGVAACEAAVDVPVDGPLALVHGSTAVLVTEVGLDKAQCVRVAISARDGAVRTGLSPAVVLVAALGARELSGALELDGLCGAAADAVQARLAACSH
ncbi:peptidase S58, DmpA [Actinokineospora sp. G85]|uniref:peptidase S58, DmpA n=1 Tax=Actinokineospora sp. G85 TaxID=3406626 RepID=UPI003C7326DF